jgi:electron transfer flavoprotein alpha/beta subunit
MAARSREIAQRSVADVGDADVPADGAWSTRVTAADAPPARAAGRVVRGAPDEAARELVDFLAARRLI